MPSCTAGPNMFPGYKATHGNTLLHRHGYIQEIDKQQPECHCLFHEQAQRERQTQTSTTTREQLLKKKKKNPERLSPEARRQALV